MIIRQAPYREDNSVYREKRIHCRMNYKILKIQDSSFYELRSLNQGRREFAELSYKELMDFYQRNRFMYSNNFVRYMRAMGNEADEIFYDIEFIQKKWASEQDVKYSEKCWKQDIMLQQVKFIKPDVIYLQDVNMFPEKVLRDLHNELPFLKCIVVYLGFPHNYKKAGYGDLIFSACPLIREKLKAEGIRSHLLYHAFDASVLEKLSSQPNSPGIDFTFVGKSGFLNSGCQLSRYWALSELAKRTPIQLWISEDLNRLALYKTKRFPKRFSPMRPLSELFTDRCFKSVFGLEMLSVLQDSKITFNKHIDPVYPNVGNMRLFEATGVGTCLLTDAGDNMHQIFLEDKEVVTYKSIDECIEKLNFLLENEDQRRSIAASGQKRTLKEHTVEQRCLEMDALIGKELRGSI